jgi:hypothetical protein
MKTILITVTFLIISSFSIKHNNNCLSFQDSKKYRVYKIDSINDYYIIYAKKEKTIYKIISKKDNSYTKNKIRINKFYRFNLRSMLMVNGKSVIPTNQINEITGWRVDKNTTINFEGDSIRDIYISDDIKGLCLIKKTKYIKKP